MSVLEFSKTYKTLSLITCRVHLEGSVHELLGEIVVVAVEEVLALGQQLLQGVVGAPGGGGCVGGIFCWTRESKALG